MTFLLKPNHSLGLVVFPWVLRAFAGIRGWRDRPRRRDAPARPRMGVRDPHGRGLRRLSCFRLSACSCAARRPGREAVDVATVIGINLLVVSPYLVMLFRGYGVLDSGPASKSRRALLTCSRP
jgi:hypothetical protein